MHLHKKLAAVTALLLLAGLGACDNNKNGAAQSPVGDSINTPPPTVNNNVTADTIVTGLENPWGLAFLPDGRVLITEKSGRLRVVQNNSLQTQAVSGVPAVFAQGQGGLLDIQLHPNYAQNGWIYMTYSKPGANGTASTALMRAKLQGNTLTEQRDLFIVKPILQSGAHFGSRIAFDGNGHVFISTGERFNFREQAQELGSHNGKIIRLKDDGTVPADNPFVTTANAQPEIWSYGHRNPQGLVWDAATATLWAHEHGPKGGDEINLVQKGKNYGWPQVSYGVNYDGSIVSNQPTKAGVENPLHVWVPSIAPCGLTIVTSDRYPGWKGSLVLGALAGQQVVRLSRSNNKIAAEEKMLQGMARFRAITQGPDGYLYAVTENPGMLLRIRLK